MKYRVIHRTEYEYSELAAVCHNVAHLSPRTDAGQHCSSHYLSVVPQPAILDERTDHYGNRSVYFSIEKPHKTMVVTATSMVEPRPVEATEPSANLWRTFAADLERMPPAEQALIRSYRLESPMAPHLPELRAFAAPSFEAHPTVAGAAADLMRRIFSDFTYDPAFTTLATPLRDVLVNRRGVCQDFAHLAVAGLRAYGLAARYVSGYLETQPPPGKEKLAGADASHAWLAVFAPDRGWIDLDPTNNQHPDERYITLAWGRDYADVAPLKGVVFGGGSHRMTVSVDVEPMT